MFARGPDGPLAGHRRAVRNTSELARLCHVTGPRVTPVMPLLDRAPDIQEQPLVRALLTQGRDPITEKDLRRICRQPSFARQGRMWQGLKRG